MKYIFLIFSILLLITSCKISEITYDSRMKTEEMWKEEMYSENGPLALQIVFDKSLQDEYIKVKGFDFHNTADWVTLFEGKLDICDEHVCKVFAVNSAVAFHLYINGKKFELESTDEHSLSSYKYLFVSKEGKAYKLHFSNYPKVVW